MVLGTLGAPAGFIAGYLSSRGPCSRRDLKIISNFCYLNSRRDLKIISNFCYLKSRRDLNIISNFCCLNSRRD